MVYFFIIDMYKDERIFENKIYLLSGNNKRKGMSTVFEQRVYDYLITIPAGRVVTYCQIAEYLGDKKLSRAVGNALHKNPDPISRPCFKVVSCVGKLAENFSMGIDKQKEWLIADGIEVLNNMVDLEKYQWKQ